MPPYDPDRHGPRRIVGPGFHLQVHTAVRAIPAGCVASYGDVAASIGSRSVARQVGWALSALPDSTDVPWHRVVNSRGVVTRIDSPSGREQVRRLRAEGVDVDGSGRIVGFATRRLASPGGGPSG